MTRSPASSPTRITIRRPVLAPGLRVLPRAPGELEIGLSAAHRLRVPDTPAVRRVLAVLDRGESPRDTPANRSVLARLAPVLRDGDTLLHPALPPSEAAAAVLRHPRDVGRRLMARTGFGVEVVGDPVLLEHLEPHALLRRCGLRTPPAGRGPSAVLLLSQGEPDRERLDPLMRSGTPHLLLRAVESEVVLGPFVLPGSTACLRCVDGHLTATDPEHERVLAEYQRAGRHDGVAEPVDLAVAASALGWAVADLVRYAEQDRPATWSATIAFASGRTGLEATTWLRHPRCGCSWGDDEVA